MSNEDKLRVTFDMPGKDTKTYEADFVMATILNEGQKSTNVDLTICGHAHTKAFIEAWVRALVTTIKGMSINTNRRSLHYDSVFEKLKDAIEKEDPEVLDENGELITNSLIKKFMADMLKGSEEEED